MTCFDGEQLIILYIKSDHTCVPSLRSVKSRVVPDGTARAERMIVEHEVFDTLADEAPPEPEKVHVVARLSSCAASVGSGAGAGAARAD